MESLVVAANLKRIRTAKGLSQDQLAADAGLSRSAYRNIESGKVARPRVRTLEALAGALGVSLREFFEPALVLRQVRFRSSRRLRTRGQILADAARWLRDYGALEGLLADRRPFELGSMLAELGADARQPIEVARRARERLGLSPDEPIHDICGLLDSAGVKVLPKSVASDGFFGLSIGPADGGPAIVVNTWERISVERWIFTAAHELGHVLLHLEDFSDASIDEDPEHEREANAFASEFLMPDAVFRREWGDAYGLPLVDRVLKVKRIFRVSYKTVLHRLHASGEPVGNLWVRFHVDYRRARGRSLSGTDEPDALEASAFDGGAPEPRRASEPEHLSDADFREDRLARLVRRAIEADEISLGRGAEILGISLLEMRGRAAGWVG